MITRSPHIRSNRTTSLCSNVTAHANGLMRTASVKFDAEDDEPNLKVMTPGVSMFTPISYNQTTSSTQPDLQAVRNGVQPYKILAVRIHDEPKARAQAACPFPQAT